MKLEKAKELKIKILDKAPKGWKKLNGALTQPCGYEWYCNGKSRFGGEYNQCLVKINY